MRHYPALVSKRARKPRKPVPPSRRRPTHHTPVRRAEPDLVDQIAATLDGDDPLPLLGLASTLIAALDPPSRGPFVGPSDGPSLPDMVESLLGVPTPETSALLAAVAALSGDQVLRKRVHREITERAHPLPAWLAGIPRATATPRAVQVTHVLGDGDNVLVAVELPGRKSLTAVVYIDHNMGTLVKDAFVVPEPLDDVAGHVLAAAADDPDTTSAPLEPADARARISEAVELGAMTFPPCESDTWPACRPLVEWMTALLPGGGTGYERPEWDDAAVEDLARRFRASPFAVGVADPTDLLSALLWFGTGYGPGDPLRWSPVTVEIVLLDWIPRKIVAPADELAAAPDVLRAFVRFCHDERGIGSALTEQTAAAIDTYAPAFQRLIRSDRPQGPAALLAAMEAFGEPEPDMEFHEIMLESLQRMVGGEAALDGLDADPLPDEPFTWDAVPPDVHDRVAEVLGLVDGCCDDLLDAQDRDHQYRTVCRRLLADAAAGDPDIFRRRARANTAAAALCWIAGKANSLFDRDPELPKLQVKDLSQHFGLTGAGVSQRSGPLLRAIGVDPQQYGRVDLASPRYLTGPRRARIRAHRDRYRAMAD